MDTLLIILVAVGVMALIIGLSGRRSRRKGQGGGGDGTYGDGGWDSGGDGGGGD